VVWLSHSSAFHSSKRLPMPTRARPCRDRPVRAGGKAAGCVRRCPFPAFLRG
jgi:hypothetical protein